jgi:hypothetical protein
LISHEDRLKVLQGEYDKNRFAVAGDSAGGTLAGCVAIEAKQRHIHLCHQLLAYPCTVAFGINPTCPANTVTKSFADAYHGPMLSNRAIIFYTDILFGKDRETTITTSLMSYPRYKLEGIAPATIITARHDPLHDEGLLYAKYLKSLGVPVDYNSYNSIHGFWGIPVFDYGEEGFNYTVHHLRHAFMNCSICNEKEKEKEKEKENENENENESGNNKNRNKNKEVVDDNGINPEVVNNGINTEVGGAQMKNSDLSGTSVIKDDNSRSDDMRGDNVKGDIGRSDRSDKSDNNRSDSSNSGNDKIKNSAN